MSNWSNKVEHEKAKGNDYKAIRLWGQQLGSYDYYIDAQVLKARATKAPQDAIYQRENGTWATLRDIKDLDKRTDLREFIGLQEA